MYCKSYQIKLFFWLQELWQSKDDEYASKEEDSITVRILREYLNDF